MAQFRQRMNSKSDTGILGKSYKSINDENAFIPTSKQPLGAIKRTVLGSLSTNVELKRDAVFGKPKVPQVSIKPAFTIFEDDTRTAPEVSKKPQEILSVQPETRLQEDVCPESPMRIDRSLNESFDAGSSLESDLSSYRQEIYQFMKELEIKNRPKPHYMRKQPDITSGMRSILVDWLIEVAEEYKLHAETLYLAIHYIDRFLSTMSVLRSKLQLVGTASMFIAAKYEEIYPPDVGEFVYITDDTYSKKQVLRMEQLVLKVLSFDMAVPTAHYFLECFCSWMKTSTEVGHLAEYLCELTLLHADPFLQFLPSEIACSALALASHTLDLEIWNADLSLCIGYDFNDFRDCFECLHATFCEAPSHPQQAIREKYSTSRYSSVALYTPHPLRSSDAVFQK